PPQPTLFPYTTLFRSARQSKFENLKSKFLLAPGFPWRARFPVQRRRPRHQRRNLKTRCGTENKDQMPDFARADFGGARLCRADRSEEHTSELQSRENL